MKESRHWDWCHRHRPRWRNIKAWLKISARDLPWLALQGIMPTWPSSRPGLRQPCRSGPPPRPWEGRPRSSAAAFRRACCLAASAVGGCRRKDRGCGARNVRPIRITPTHRPRPLTARAGRFIEGPVAAPLALRRAVRAFRRQSTGGAQRLALLIKSVCVLPCAARIRLGSRDLRCAQRQSWAETSGARRRRLRRTRRSPESRLRSGPTVRWAQRKGIKSETAATWRKRCVSGHRLDHVLEQVAARAYRARDQARNRVHRHPG